MRGPLIRLVGRARLVVALHDHCPACVADAIGASGALATKTVPNVVAGAVAWAGDVVAATVPVGGRLGVLAGGPVVRLLDRFAPLGRRVDVRLDGSAVLASLLGA